ncbi:Sec-independent protein translocase protein TatB [Edaphovirga cremea]|uniref:Sec-independent protein translocase protein TatB n=1 Tax=Edaphovirga cremea TaxID=2267246 RepID=UPI000DEF6141|nr:Sec-independent protein translocase protein TatB [Edaphovirga cremea]
MFDIGFGELVLVMVIGLVVLGPERLPVAVRTVAGWIRALRSLAATVQTELSQELKLQELQDSLKKAEEAGLKNLTPELKASMDELREAAESMKRSYKGEVSSIEAAGQENSPQTIHNPAPIEAEALHDGVTPGDAAHAAHVATASAKAPPAQVNPAAVINTSDASVAPVEPINARETRAASAPVTKPETPEMPGTAAEDIPATVKPTSSHQPSGDR